jgi:hypothetical protein
MVLFTHICSTKTGFNREERTVDLTFVYPEKSVRAEMILQLPEVYPGGVATLTGPHGQSSYSGTIESILEQICGGLLF